MKQFRPTAILPEGDYFGRRLMDIIVNVSGQRSICYENNKFSSVLPFEKWIVPIGI